MILFIFNPFPKGTNGILPYKKAKEFIINIMGKQVKKPKIRKQGDTIILTIPVDYSTTGEHTTYSGYGYHGKVPPHILQRKKIIKNILMLMAMKYILVIIAEDYAHHFS